MEVIRWRESSELHWSIWFPVMNKTKIKCTFVYHQNSEKGDVVFVCSAEVSLASLKKVVFLRISFITFCFPVFDLDKNNETESDYSVKIYLRLIVVYQIPAKAKLISAE